MILPADVVRLLHRIHRQLADLRDRFEAGPKQIRARDTNLNRLSEELVRVQAEAKAVRIRADQKQLLLKANDEKIERHRSQLNQCTTNREYQALKDQIAADQMAGSVLSDEILEALEKIDESQVHLREAQEKIVAAKEELVRTQQAVQATADSLAADIKRLEEELKQAEAALPEDFAQVYLRAVKSKGADAMAEVQDDCCGGCYQQLTPNVIAELVMSRALICRTCGRLIYLPEDRTRAGRR